MANTDDVIEQVDSAGRGTGVEIDNVVSDGAEAIAEPFNPEDIDVVTRSMTVNLLLSRTKSDMIDLQPDFQRRWGVWDARRQSRLIESLMLRIPLPVLYAAEDDDERWEIVDGIQRLSTIARFMEPEAIGSAPLVLAGLEYLKDFEGKRFGDLTPRMRLRLQETELIIHLIRKGTPPEVKFNIFARINTGGMALSPQELRHAITPGRARAVLEQWAGSQAFKLATDGSVQPIRMDDRELVLRFIAFHCLGLEGYKQPDMDGFLIAAMNTVNHLTDHELSAVNERFTRAMNTARAVFGRDAFRKRFSQNASRLPINKALFEAISVNFAQLPAGSMPVLVERAGSVREGLIALCNSRDFESAISQGTGDVRKVQRRFSAIAEMLQRVLQNA